ncbi:MAG TPA: glycoside hydrolase family 32 protein, partial [Actinopolymorphaceae bacterium]
LFAQHNPDAPRWGPMHWAHAEGPDGVHWRNLPIALRPSPPVSPDDESGIFSGNAVDDNGVLTVFYTIFTDVRARPGAVPETVGTATSTDGVEFVPYAGNPIIAERPAESDAGFRDPCVFRDPTDDRWKLAIGSGHDGRGNVHLYASDDLRQWTYVGVLARGDGSTGGMWECPSFFLLGDSWVLLVSANNTVHALVGAYDGTRFEPRSQGVLDAGPAYYAAQHYRDDRGRDLVLAWMHRWGQESPTVAEGWAGALTITRELFATEDGRVGTRPIREVESLREGEPTVHTALEVSPGQVVTLGRGTSLDVTVDLDPRGATSWTLRVLASDQEATESRYDVADGLLTLDTTRSGESDGGTWSVPLRPDASGTTSLRLLVDRSSVEVFGADGTALTALVHPRSADSDRVELAAYGGTVRVRRAEVWRLGSCWLD